MAAVTVELPDPEQLAALSGHELDRIMLELEQARRRIDATIADVVDHCDRTAHYLADGHRSVKGWAMATTNCSPGEALRRQQTARAMHALPTVAKRFRAGHVGVAQVHELGRLAANPRCADQLPPSEQLLLDAATQLEYVDFRVVTQRWQQLADADGAHHSHEATHAHRNARLVEIDGEFRLETSHGVVQGAAMREIFEKFCEAEFHADWDATVAEHGDRASKDLMPRTAAQRRADALVAIFEAAATAGIAGKSIQVVLNLIMDVDSFEQYTREQIEETPVAIDPASVRERRCETTDGIPVDPRHAVALAFLGKIRRIVLDEHGVIIAAGRARRLFDGALREAIQAIDPRCNWLGCALRAAISEIDHLQAHTDGGLTDAANGKVMCHRHNVHKHANGNIPQRLPDGRWIMLRPDGTKMQPPDAA
jgi:hypothetical protein